MKIQLSQRTQTIILFSFGTVVSLAILVLAAIYTGKEEAVIIKFLSIATLCYCLYTVCTQFEKSRNFLEKLTKWFEANFN